MESKIVESNPNLFLQTYGLVPGTEVHFIKLLYNHIYVVQFRGAMFGIRKKDFEKIVFKQDPK